MDSDESFLLIPFVTIVLLFNGSGIKVTKQMNSTRKINHRKRRCPK
jgi:hypothetical protein